MPPKLNLLALTALTALACALPATVAAAEIVPPGNSAVNQYTETFPTSKGEEKSELEKKTGVKPGDVLGAGKTRKLDEKGAAGKAVAQFTAETAPTSSSDSGSGSGEKTTGGDNGGGKGQDNGKGKQPNRGNGEENGGGEQQESAGSPGGGSTNAGSGSGGSGPSGSSAVGEIASQATGTASDSIGLWLPLILIAVVVWSGFYVWRNRQQRVV
ncbi:MAG TPA: hypothetical protein VLL27_02850 [Solirubrobacterales bacterium]|nr:hypothetical protein [Solirubrobacterales bacterium]